MKYYIPTSSLNFNIILSTESLSPKSFYEKRGFGYHRWFPVEENSIEHLTLLYKTPHMFERPKSDMEDHPMLIEIDVDEEFPKVAEDISYTDRTIYFNPWQTQFIFFNEKDMTIALSLSDSSVETKLVRLYQKKICVCQFEGTYSAIQRENVPPVGDIDGLIERDFIINKMKGLLYGYYIGANLSSTKEHVQKLDVLCEIKNIFSSVLSSYDKTPSETQHSRLIKLFDYLDSQQTIYYDLEKEVCNKQKVESIIAVFKRHGIDLPFIDREKLIDGLQGEVENNQSISWVNCEIASTIALMDSSRVMLDPDEAEIIVSSKEKVVDPKAISDKLMYRLFVNWINEVLCSKSFNGKINSIKESLSDEITKSARNVIAEGWENSQVRTYLNQLRRHVRGEEFNQIWDNGVLSSLSAVLIKGDDWEQLLNFMQSKGMYDYRLAFAMYGVLNGFADLTRDFTDLLLNKDSNYLSKVYRDFYGQLLEKSIPGTLYRTPVMEPNKSERNHVENNTQNIVLQHPEEMSLKDWQNEIRNFANSVIKRDKQKLLNSLEEAIKQNGNNKDYFIFITMLDNFEGWKPGKNEPSTAWKRLQEHYVPDFDQRTCKPTKKKRTTKKPEQQGIIPFDNTDDCHNVAKSDINSPTIKSEDNDTMIEPHSYTKQPVSRTGKSILEDKTWIRECASFIYEPKAKEQFKEDAEWFVDNHNDTYIDKKGVSQTGFYAGKERANESVLERLKKYLENKKNSSSAKMQWLVKIYENIHIAQIVDHISKVYGI